MKTRIVVVIEGGVVQAVISDSETPGVNVAIIDYDVEGVPEVELTTFHSTVDDRQSTAYVIEHRVEEAKINLDEVLKEEEDDVPTHKYLDASTGHITERDSSVLQDNHDLGIRVLPDEYGFFISLAAFKDEETKKEVTRRASEVLSYAFFQLVEYAVENGCDYINLDRDADLIDGLPSFDW